MISQLIQTSYGIQAVDLSFHAKLLDGSTHQLKYLGVAIRGILGYGLKRAFCQVKHVPCENCMLRQGCAYAQVFDGIVNSTEIANSKNLKKTQPFILGVASPNDRIDKKDELHWTIRLMGDAIQWAPHLVQIFIDQGPKGIGSKRLPFSLQHVTQTDSASLVLWDTKRPNDWQIPTTYLINEEIKQAPQDGTLRWHFHTPFTLRKDSKLNIDIGGLDIVLAGRRRWRNLTNLYGKNNSNADNVLSRLNAEQFKVESKSIQRWKIMRYSGRQKRAVPLSGILGHMDISGPWSQAGDWIRVVHKIHLGKSATFGFGRVSWEQIVQ